MKRIILSVLALAATGVATAQEAYSLWSVTPKAEKYYSISPYAYCANNPVNAIDPDGKRIVLDKGVSKFFRRDYELAVQTFHKMGCGNVWKQLNESNKTYIITETDKFANSFDPKTKTISWNSRKGLFTNNFVKISPATRLNHELDHALQFDRNPKQFYKDINTHVGGYDQTYTKEEKRAIEGAETQTAISLGEINEGETTRYDHDGQPFTTDSPISNKELYPIEVIVTPNHKLE